VHGAVVVDEGLVSEPELEVVVLVERGVEEDRFGSGVDFRNPFCPKFTD
jgi:hypothetical protein